MTTAPVVRAARSDELAPIAELLGDAFEHDPLVAAVVPDTADAAVARRAIFATTARSARAHGAVLVAELDGRVVGAALIDDPARSVVRQILRRFADAVRFLPLVASVGSRGMQLLNDADLAGRRLAPDAPHHVLLVVGVAAHLRGGGIGKLLIEATIARAATSAGVRLETENPENVPRYGRWGFVERGTHRLGSVTVWGMFRPTIDAAP
ncbi:MAG: GNAT family N-acetyltransferase [Pseudolysinimonas sp.]|uniref:GNAT family N-acetyltransferase n=1 Tax=Pseudolysinimonas sp. TaxID=2680009 RepID=UPI003C791202